MLAKSLYNQILTLSGGDCAVARKMPLMAANIGFRDVQVGGSMDVRANKRERELASSAWKGIFTGDSMKGACEKHGILRKGDIELINEGMTEFCSTDGAVFLLPQPAKFSRLGSPRSPALGAGETGHNRA
ncbi:hypothetical protein FGB62_50g210 [Gracilaria domingensis]|nr:hypothetical protein FGB62_50g210 [Gracilaria domingensis]